MAKLKEEDLIYLAGMIDTRKDGIKFLNDTSAACTFDLKDTETPQVIAKLYGGEIREFASGRTGKPTVGWFVSLEDRLRLLKLAEPYLKCDKLWFDRVVGQFEKTINTRKVRPQ
jgi:hypothetical protein